MTEVTLKDGSVIVKELTAFEADLLSPTTGKLIPCQGQPAPEKVVAAADITRVSPVLVGILGAKALITV